MPVRGACLVVVWRLVCGGDAVLVLGFGLLALVLDLLVMRLTC